jgi:hypothetical protein
MIASPFIFIAACCSDGSVGCADSAFPSFVPILFSAAKQHREPFCSTAPGVRALHDPAYKQPMPILQRNAESPLPGWRASVQHGARSVAHVLNRGVYADSARRMSDPFLLPPAGGPIYLGWAGAARGPCCSAGTGLLSMTQCRAARGWAGTSRVAAKARL